MYSATLEETLDLSSAILFLVNSGVRVCFVEGVFDVERCDGEFGWCCVFVGRWNEWKWREMSANVPGFIPVVG